MYFSMLLSFAFLVIINLILARSSRPVPWSIALCASFNVCPGFLIAIFPAIAIQAAFLCLLLVVLILPTKGRFIYLPLSFIATVAAYSIVFLWTSKDQQELAQAQEEYAFENMENRLSKQSSRNSLPPNNLQHLKFFESEVASASNERESSRRNFALIMLHGTSVDRFVKRSGFGVGRTVRTPSSASLLKQLQSSDLTRAPVQQPDYTNPFISPSNNLTSRLQDWNSDKTLRLHDDGVLDFINPIGFGYIKDREHVAGFQKHGMTKVPKADTRWSVAHLELVGLIVHEKPVVYMTANLPQMEEAQHAPKRALDSFELEGLKALQEGEDLYYRGSEDKARMMGSIRAVEQCLQCHGGSSGQLLGAFSYGLRRE
jgi:hypothetical protein